MQRAARLKCELHMLSTEPPHGVTCWLVENSVCELEAQVSGQEGTPYHRGMFKILLHLPERYPFEAPKVRFSTPIYHPNIDTGGRICLDILKPPPSGSWRPSMNISSILTSILLLMAEPNPDDPLMVEISTEFKQNRAQFARTAVEWTKRYASGENLTAAACGAESATTRSSAGDAKPLASASLPASGGSGGSASGGSLRRAGNGPSLSLRTPAVTTAGGGGATRTETSLRRRQPLAPSQSRASTTVPCSVTDGRAGSSDTPEPSPAAKQQADRSGGVPEAVRRRSDPPPPVPSPPTPALDARQRAASPGESGVHVIAPAAVEPVARGRPANVPVECVIIDDSDDDDDDKADFGGTSSLAGDVRDVAAHHGACAVKRVHSSGDENDDENDDDDNTEWSEAKRQFCSHDNDESDVVYRSDEDIL